MDIALLIGRLILGLGLAAHGSQKLFGWFGGYGPRGTAGFFESIGFRPGIFFALSAGGCEFVGGLLVAIGFLGPIGPALILCAMLVAILAVHAGHGFFSDRQGMELPLAYLGFAVVLALTGFGLLSLDGAVGFYASPGTAWSIVLLAVILAILNALYRALMVSGRQAGAPTG